MKLNILLVEDNPGDAHLARKGLKKLRIENEVFLVTDGLQAMQFLKKEGPYESVRRPDLILLDLNLPGKHGHEVLTEIKQSPEFKSIPVMILTSSTNETDVRKSYLNYANCYLVKPMEVDEYIKLTDSIGNFWMERVRLPAPLTA